MKTQRPIVILDFGAQYTQLIARRIRELSVYCEVHPFSTSLEKLRALNPQGIILSGGPASCLEPSSPTISAEVYGLGAPVLGICYGAQLTAKLLGGKVEKAASGEYGPATMQVTESAGLFAGFQPKEPVAVWMSHGDRVAALPKDFTVQGTSEHSPYAAFACPAKQVFCVQFHPEVVHTPRGKEVLSNFVLGICGASPTWTMSSFAEQATADVKAQIGETENVILALSGGVDSSVVAALLSRALGPRLVCIFVDNGLLRQGERQTVETTFGKHFNVTLRVIDAKDRFLRALTGVTDPEQKRKIIGREFIRVFEEEARSVKNASFLAQGTLYPDVIESVSDKGPSAVIKSHHNVGGLPPDMKMQLLEPVRMLFKDEVRQLGLTLGMPEEIVFRQPFPGPGLAVRCLGEVTEERLVSLRAADAIVYQEVKNAGLYREIWQAFAVLLPVKTVGVMGDSRTYADVLAIRAVTSDDGMTADWARLPPELLAKLSARIINEVPGINRVVYDITSKPPGTIEWE